MSNDAKLVKVKALADANQALDAMYVQGWNDCLAAVMRAADNADHGKLGKFPPFRIEYPKPGDSPDGIPGAPDVPAVPAETPERVRKVDPEEPAPAKPESRAQPTAAFDFHYAGHKVALTRSEYIFADKLYGVMGKGFITREDLSAIVWPGRKPADIDASLSVLASTVRRKLTPLCLGVRTVPKMGYALITLDEALAAIEEDDA